MLPCLKGRMGELVLCPWGTGEEEIAMESGKAANKASQWRNTGSAEMGWARGYLPDGEWTAGKIDRTHECQGTLYPQPSNPNGVDGGKDTVIKEESGENVAQQGCSITASLLMRQLRAAISNCSQHIIKLHNLLTNFWVICASALSGD